MALLSGASELQASTMLTGVWSSAFVMNRPLMIEMCRVGYNREMCLSAKPGYMINLEKYRSPVGAFGTIKYQDYEVLAQGTKNFVHVFENNAGSKFMVSCHASCKK